MTKLRNKDKSRIEMWDEINPKKLASHVHTVTPKEIPYS